MILACWLVSLPFAALGILVGLAAGTSLAQAAMVGTTLVLNVLGGLRWPLPVFLNWLQDIAQVLPTYRLADLGHAAVTRHALNPADMAFMAAWTLLFGAIPPCPWARFGTLDDLRHPRRSRHVRDPRGSSLLPPAPLERRRPSASGYRTAAPEVALTRATLRLTDAGAELRTC